MAKQEMNGQKAGESQPKEQQPRSQQAKGQRKRRHLIEAAIRVVGRKGVARATIQDVAKESGLSVGLANFYFAGKEELFSAAFQDLAEEYEAVWRKRTDGLREPREILDAMVIAAFDSVVFSQPKAAAWFAFWGEACHGDSSLQAIDRIEKRCADEILRQCRNLARQHGLSPTQARQIGLGLGAMIEGLWSASAVPGSSMKAKTAIQICRDYIAASFAKAAASREVAGHMGRQTAKRQRLAAPD
ncbi:transcriptional regulator BetI [Dongia soli]|uniref:Transcriptional regulator BetI n=1 Tax=Dongia soli TaxID=600628 RepID=A0ABU5E6X5_9PROT|nr:transcriptional regulator BetI [Dongia soli]MDY0881390.1 transcriptional regulator BetI [Dongia soli]